MTIPPVASVSGPTPVRVPAVSARRRVMAWFLDALIVGLPALILSILIPVIPVGLLIWGGYRTYAGVSGRSVGRNLCGWSMRATDGSKPGTAGWVWFAYASSGPLVGVLVFVAGLCIASPGGWAWLLWVPLIGALAGVCSLAVSMFWWSGLMGDGPRLDRVAKVTPVRLARPHHPTLTVTPAAPPAADQPAPTFPPPGPSAS